MADSADIIVIISMIPGVDHYFFLVKIYILGFKIYDNKDSRSIRCLVAMLTCNMTAQQGR